MKKRAELTSSQIATLVLSIAGFIIALVFLLVFLDTDTMSEREICRLSVLTRATAPEVLQRLAPLKCTTQKICLSKSGNNKCDDDQFVGENKEKIIEIKVAAKEDIEKTVADSMYDCWTMMGEGKLDVFGGGGKIGILGTLGWANFIKKETSCVICSRLSLSKDLQQDNTLLDNVDISSYIETHQVPGSEKTYLQSFTDYQVRSYPQKFRDNLSNSNTNSKVKPTDEIAIVFMQINTEDDPWTAGSETGMKTGAFVFGTTTGVGPLGFLTLKIGLVAGFFSALASGTLAAIQTYRSRDIAAGYCGKFTSISKGREGCSVIVPFDYQKIQDINNYCSVIEGTP
jgi:hypothetical protein